jgi:hypothetical protein
MVGLAGGLSGCGASQPSSGSITVATATGTTVSSPTISSASGGVQDRLTRAGYAVTTARAGTGNPPATAALGVPLSGGGTMAIYFYASAADAARAAVPFAALKLSNPKQFSLRRVGAHLYIGTIKQPATLRLSAFNQIVSTAETP